MKLLIADDEPVIVRGLAKLLDYAALGFDTVLSTSDSTRALELVRTEKPDVLLSDIVMPDITGLDLLEALHCVMPDAKAVFLSGFPNFEFAQTALSLGAMGYLLKPVDEVKLNELLSKALQELIDSREKNALQKRVRQLTSREAVDDSLDAIDRISTASVDSPSYYCLVVMRMEEQAGLSPLDSGLLRFSIYNRAENIANGKACVSFVKDDNLVLVIRAESESAAPKNATAVSQTICDVIINELCVGMFFAISDTLADTRAIPDAYRKAASLLEARSVQLDVPPESELDKVKRYIQTHYSDNLTLYVMAEVACMSPSYFSAYFRKLTGLGFKEYLTQVRIEAAELLLCTTDLKVYEIASRVGFSDPRYFADTFRKVSGCTPLNYKKRHHK